MMNIYNGVVKLDNKGEAVVELPDYFEALKSGLPISAHFDRTFHARLHCPEDQRQSL